MDVKDFYKIDEGRVETARIIYKNNGCCCGEFCRECFDFNENDDEGCSYPYISPEETKERAKNYLIMCNLHRFELGLSKKSKEDYT